MNTQAVPPTINSATSASVTGTAPQLGAMIPGTTGGLPALSGLSVTQNPMAQQLQSMGRGDDKVLVHMTPEEVNSLQGLAMASGGSLTINPHTGLPEAGWLGKLLPTILGFAGAAFGLPTWAIGLGGAAAGTAATGSLSQGLMMGLQAFGGASLAGGLGVGEAGKKVTEEIAKQGAKVGTGVGGVTPPPVDPTITGVPIDAMSGSLTNLGAVGTGATGIAPVAEVAAQTAKVGAKAPGFLGRMKIASQMDLPGGIIGKAAPYAAGMGLLSGVSEATAPRLPKYKEDDEPGLQYREMEPLKREVRFQTPEQMEASGGAEFQYFTPTNPEPMPVAQSVAQPMDISRNPRRRFAEGGTASFDAPPGFNDLVAAYSANNPGAITASMKYPASTPATGGEQLYNLNPQPATPPAGGGIGGGGLGGFGGFNFDNFDFSAITDYLNTLPQGTPLPSYSAPGYDMPIVDTPIMDTPGFDMPRGMDYFGGNYAGGDFSSPIYSQPISPETSYDLPTQQPTYSEPVYDQPSYSAPVYEQPSYSPPNYDMPVVDAPIMDMPSFDMSRGMDFFGGSYSEPTPQPSYSESAYFSPNYDLPMQQPSYSESAYFSPNYDLPMQQPSYPESAYFSPIYSEPTPQPSYMYPYYGEPSPTTPTYFEPPQTDFFGPLGGAQPGFDSGPLMYDFNNEGAMDYGMFAKGGAVAMRDGAFVVDARTVSELGNGSSNAGIEMLSRMGGTPVRGPGDGVSDSVPAKIGGKQEARVARDEVIFQPDAVRRIGKGSEKRGTQKLYALMEKAHKARKKAARGQDTGVRRGLG